MKIPFHGGNDSLVLGEHICGWSLPRRRANLLQITEGWLSNYSQFKGHRSLEILSVLVYVPAGGPRVPDGG